MKHNVKRFLSLALALLMVLSNVPAQAFAAEADTLPNATVTVLDPMTLAAGGYSVYDGSNLSDGTEDLPLQIVMNFKANDSLEQAQAGSYGDWLCDFYLTFDGLEEGSFTAVDSYLAGNYGTFGWIAIPTDTLTLDAGVEYPVVSGVVSDLTYESICDSVKDFTAALYISPEILEANPDFKVTLKLKMTDPENAENVLTIGEPAVFTAEDLLGETGELPNATVTVLDPMVLDAGEYDVWGGGSSLTEGTEAILLQAVMNFKANDTLEQAQAGSYADWICDFYLTFDGMAGDSISGDGSYLAGNYGSYGWIMIPTDGLTVEAGVEYPVVTNYDPQLTYENVCDYVKEFTAALYLNPETLLANPDMTVTLALKMTNPENPEDCLVIGEPAVYTAPELNGKIMPEAEVEVLDRMTLAAGEYDVWGGGSSLTEGTEDLPLQAVMNFKAKDSLAAAKLGGYGKWICDFYLTFDGMAGDSISGDGSYLAGNYGSYGWIMIPTDGLTVEEDVEYPVVTNYDPQLTYENICDYVKEFTAALYLNPETLLANPDMTVTLALKMVNPENPEDYLIIGDAAVYTAAELYGEHLPEAEVTVLDPLTLAAGEYNVWGGGSSLTEGTEELPLQVLMNFKALETLAEAQLGGYGKWICDFYLTFDGLENDAIVADDCYLAGNYGNFGWITIPTDGLEIVEGERYPVVTNYDPQLTYENICDYVKEFTAAIYVAPEILAQNPDFTVTLALQMTNPADPDEIITIGEPAVFTMGDLLSALGYVAQNTTTKKLYDDVNDANDEAAEGETVILLTDVTVNRLFVSETFDLNGYALTAKYVTSFGNIVDNSESNAGLLKVATDYFLARQDNAQLPVNTPDGYQFVEILGFNYRYLEASQKFVFQPLFEEYAHELLLAGPAVSGIDVQVKVSWENTAGEYRDSDFGFNDAAFLEGYLNSYNPATGKYGKMFTMKVIGATRDLTYQVRIVSDNGVVLASGTTFVEITEEETTTTEQTTLNTNAEANQASALVPKGTKLAESATADSLTLTVAEVENSQSNIVLEENEALKSVDVHIEGIAEDNTVPAIITLPEFAEPGLNAGNFMLYHVENGATNPMTQVSAQAEVDAHNEFFYDPATGDVTMALATFSEIASVINTDNAWNGTFDYSWYDAGKREFVIANADQLAAFGAIVGGMDGQTRDSFEGKTVKLICDINIGDLDSENGVVFYPIGYYNSEGTYEKTNTAITSGLKAFEGTFDGQGHTISDFYQNTWEMKGDHNWYDAALQYYRDGMGLFGQVYGGTVKNLTVANFSSDGEIATTGVIAAYADCGASFENIAIVNCNPRVYNIGNGGIVGCVGWYANEATDTKVTFKNITVDNSNKISALWGSYDVACGGIVGQYYPTSGQTAEDGSAIKNAGIYFENCHVAAQMDVYNDVCANYQYYAYRYAGMLIGSIRENETIDGHVYPKMDGIEAKGCTVNFGDWNDYYYCELVANSIASYTHDYQFSRLEQVDSVNVANMTVTVDGESTAIPTSGRVNYVVVNGEHAAENATCYHFVDGKVHNHSDYDGDGEDDYETVDVDGDGVKETVLVENNQHIYLEFNNLFTGYGWGVTSKGLTDFAGVETDDPIDVEEGQEESINKFDLVFENTETYLYRVGNLNPVKVSSLFKAADLPDGVEISSSGVYVSITDMHDDARQMGTYTPSTTGNWLDGTIEFENTGAVKVTIQDYDFCEPTVLYLEVVDGHNVTTYSELKTSNANSVLLNNITMTGDTMRFTNCTVFGNGFEFDISQGANSGDSNSNYSVIGLADSNLDNICIKGAVYQSYGVMVSAEYSAAAVGTSGNCTISNSYISNCLSPVKALSGTLTIEDTTLHGGRFCNLDVRGANVILNGVTTINTSAGGTKVPEGRVLGLGIVVYYQNSDAAKITIGDKGLIQHNWIYIEGTDTTTGDYQYFNVSGIKNAFDMMFDINTKHTVDGKTFVNTGIVSLNTTVDEADIMVPAGYAKEDVKYTSYDGYLWTPSSYNAEKLSYNDYEPTKQGAFKPDFAWNHPAGDYVVEGNKITITFNEGESYTFDTTRPTATKSGDSLEITVKKDGVQCGGTVTFDASGEYVFTYEYTDPYVYGKDGSNATPVTYTETLHVVVSAIKVATPAPTFTFVTQSGTNGGTYVGTYTGQAGLADGDANGGIKTVEKDGQLWIMPDVTAADTTIFGGESGKSGNGMVGSIGCVNGIYFPIVTGKITYEAGSSFSKGTITRHYPFYGSGDANAGSITIADNGSTYSSSNASTNLLFYSEYNGTQGVGVGSADDFGLADGVTSSGASCSTCKWGISSGEISGGDATTGDYGNNLNSIYYAKFSYTAENGQTYYYYVGFAFAQETKAAKQSGGCITSDTLVTLADGAQERIDSVSADELLLVWDFYKGEYATVPASILVNHGRDIYTVASMHFSDGTTVKTINGHGFYHEASNEFVILNENNAADYIGDSFLKQDGDGFASVTLVDVTIEEKEEESWGILTAEHYNCFLEGMLTMTDAEVPGTPDYLMPFKIGEGMKYDEAKMQEDIETYGLYTYEDFADLCTFEQFVGFGIDKFKVSVGKGYITMDEIEFLLRLHG